MKYHLPEKEIKLHWLNLVVNKGEIIEQDT
jgi:hypothetical protein